VSTPYDEEHPLLSVKLLFPVVSKKFLGICTGLYCNNPLPRLFERLSLSALWEVSLTAKRTQESSMADTIVYSGECSSPFLSGY